MINNNNNNNIPPDSMDIDKEIVIKIITDYGFNFFKELSFKPIPNAMGIGDLLFNILHLQSLIWHPPLYINVFYFTNTRYYPNSINALIFRLDLLSDILSNHPKLSKNDIIFYYNNDYNENYNTNFKYDRLTSFSLESKLIIPTLNDTNYIIFNTKLRLISGLNYTEEKNKIREFCKKFKSDYTLYILGEKNMSITYESKFVGITTIYDELVLLKDNNDVIDLSIDNIYENLNYDNYKKDIGIIENAKSNIHFGVGGQFVLSLLFAKDIVHYCPIYDPGLIDIKNNPNLKIYNGFENINEFTTYMNNKLGHKSNDTITQPALDINIIVDSTNCLSYISGGRLGDFVFQLSVIHANYLKTGKKGILYIADIGDKFVRGIETAYNDTKDIILKQDYIQDYKIYNGEKYDINLSSWRDILFNREQNWVSLYKEQFNINFGVTPWINNIPINPELQNKILIGYSIQRDNIHINLTEILNKYDQTKLHFICLDENEYTNFSNKLGLHIPHTHCKNLMELFISINSCELFIGNFSAPLCVALAQHKTCIGIAPSDPKHNIDLILIKDIKKYWSHCSIIY